MKLLPGDVLKGEERAGDKRARVCDEVDLDPGNEGLRNDFQCANDHEGEELMQMQLVIARQEFDSRLNEKNQELIRLQEKNDRLQEEIKTLKRQNQQLQVDMNNIEQLLENVRMLLCRGVFPGLRWHFQPDVQLQYSREPDESSDAVPGPSRSHDDENNALMLYDGQDSHFEAWG
ncbi:hypothetical protein PspLS_10105 [Pyricularia sp. CBS 133598]|nr:hypothetical protein PspLS_10105 [Pyricularia sp. CBS 133598]